MKCLIALALLTLSCCSHAASHSSNSRQEEAGTSETERHFKEGWRSIKEGGREVAAGVSKGARKLGHAIQVAACPVAADRDAGYYYAKDSPGYEEMLSAGKSDARECFISEARAREQGYTLVR